MASSARKGRVLTIQQIFLLLAILNGIVVASLFFSAWQLLNDQASSVQHAATTSFLAALLVVGVAISYRIVSVRVTGPLSRLVRQSYAIASDEGTSDELLVARGNDEIASLAEAFNAVLLRQRQAIEQVDSANRRLREVNKPGRRLDPLRRPSAEIHPSRSPAQRALRSGAFRPLATPGHGGGDYYVFHGDGPRCLAGVADCAGHGVPGAMMTMLARAGIDRSIQQVGIESPAAVLQATNAGMHMVLSEAQLSRAIATSMDVGLVFLDFEAQLMRFAGAKISLYWSDGHNVETARGDNRSLWDRRAVTYQDHQIPLLSGFTYYMATDGVFDQAGGDHGFGLGTDRFRDWLLDHAGKPLSEQHEAFTRSLSEFMGEHPQRDDITMLSFRVA